MLKNCTISWQVLANGCDNTLSRIKVVERTYTTFWGQPVGVNPDDFAGVTTIDMSFPLTTCGA
jgi:hypothetical protein